MSETPIEKPEITDPFATLTQHEEKIALLERQVAALMRQQDERLRNATGSQNVGHAWPK